MAWERRRNPPWSPAAPLTERLKRAYLPGLLAIIDRLERGQPLTAVEADLVLDTLRRAWLPRHDLAKYMRECRLKSIETVKSLLEHAHETGMPHLRELFRREHPDRPDLLPEENRAPLDPESVADRVATFHGFGAALRPKVAMRQFVKIRRKDRRGR
jgi:hypothetical protein